MVTDVERSFWWGRAMPVIVLCPTHIISHYKMKDYYLILFFTKKSWFRMRMRFMAITTILICSCSFGQIHWRLTIRLSVNSFCLPRNSVLNLWQWFIQIVGFASSLRLKEDFEWNSDSTRMLGGHGSHSSMMIRIINPDENSSYAYSEITILHY